MKVKAVQYSLSSMKVVHMHTYVYVCARKTLAVTSSRQIIRTAGKKQEQQNIPMVT
jgi:hypothetical protein